MCVLPRLPPFVLRRQVSPSSLLSYLPYPSSGAAAGEKCVHPYYYYLVSGDERLAASTGAMEIGCRFFGPSLQWSRRPACKHRVELHAFSGTPCHHHHSCDTARRTVFFEFGEESDDSSEVWPDRGWTHQIHDWDLLVIFADYGLDAWGQLGYLSGWCAAGGSRSVASERLMCRISWGICVVIARYDLVRGVVNWDFWCSCKLLDDTKG